MNRPVEPDETDDPVGFTTLASFAPGAEDDPHGDKLTLEELAKAGSDLSKETHVRHFLLFTDEQQAREVARVLAEEIGYGTKGHAPTEDGEPWLIVTERHAVPSQENVNRMRLLMESIATKYNGEYDGWEAAVQV